MLEIHTTDRVTFKRCRRKWSWSSNIMDNLQPTEREPNWKMWLGTGFHFALEDWYGYRRFLRPEEALQAYAEAHRAMERPEPWKEAIELGKQMLAYYLDYWLRRRQDHATHWVDGIPQVEVRVVIPLLLANGKKVLYHETYDRVVVLQQRPLLLAVEDYKTVDKDFDTARLELDQQWGAYNWGARQLYGEDEVEGGIWLQFKRAVPDYPRKLQKQKEGRWFSTAKAQNTNHAFYKERLLQEYGEVPQQYISYLNDLANEEQDESDRFIKRQLVRRNAYNARAVETQIFAEVEDMLRLRDLHQQGDDYELYPNQMDKCSFDCQFRAECIARDDGSDWQGMLQEDFELREKQHEETWRTRLEYPALEVTLEQ